MGNPWDDTDIVVPDTELERPAFELLPTAGYDSTVGGGATVVENNNGWRALSVPFVGFVNTKTQAAFPNRTVKATYTLESDNEQAVQIGRTDLTKLVAALGLAEEATAPDGSSGKRIPPAFFADRTHDGETDYTRLVNAINAMGGTRVNVYVVLKERTRKGEVQLKDDGTPWMDNEVKRVSAIRG